MPDIAVAFTVSGARQKYLRQALGSWTKVRGVDDAHMIFCVEPSRGSFPVQEFQGWVRRTFRHADVFANEKLLGCLKNTKQAFGLAFAGGAPFAVMAEEDIEVATDTLEYFRWARDAYRDDGKVIMVCGHAKASSSNDLAGVTRAGWFSPLVCGTWPDRWESFVEPTWKGHMATKWDSADSQAWDTNLRWEIRSRDLFSIFPVRSRALHIGEMSTWMALAIAEHLYKDTQSDCYAPDYPVQEYREVPFDSVPGYSV